MTIPIPVLVTMVLAWSALLVGSVKFLLDRNLRQLDARITLFESTALTAQNDVRKLEREFLEFKACLPIEYYRREDMIRFETITHAKLDAVGIDIKSLECKQCKTAQ